MNAEHFAYALHCLTTHAEPEGMHNPNDEQERERLAVACIRGAKNAEGMEPESERAEYAEVSRYVAVYRMNADCSRDSAFLFSLARGAVQNANAVRAEFDREQYGNVGSYRFFRSRFVNVNGVSLKLKWAV